MFYTNVGLNKMSGVAIEEKRLASWSCSVNRLSGFTGRESRIIHLVALNADFTL